MSELDLSVWENPIEMYGHLRRRGFIPQLDGDTIWFFGAPVITIDSVSVPTRYTTTNAVMTVAETDAVAANLDALIALARSDLSAGFEAHQAMPNLAEAIWADEDTAAGDDG